MAKTLNRGISLFLALFVPLAGCMSDFDVTQRSTASAAQEVLNAVPQSAVPSFDVGPVNYIVDLSRFDTAPLIAFIAAKETNYGIETDG